MREMNIRFRSFFWADHSAPVGLLPHDRRAQACWYYVMNAHRNLHEVKEGATYEGNDDSIKMLANILVSVSTIYGISDPSETLKFMDICKQEAKRCHFEWDEGVEKVLRADYVRKISTPTQ